MLARRAGRQVGAARAQHERPVVAGPGRGPVGRRLGLDEGELQRLGRQRAAGAFVEALQQRLGALGGGLGAVDAELGVAARDLHAERRLDLAQMGVQAAADAGQAGVVDGLELEAQDHDGRGKLGTRIVAAGAFPGTAGPGLPHNAAP